MEVRPREVDGLVALTAGETAPDGDGRAVDDDGVEFVAARLERPPFLVELPQRLAALDCGLSGPLVADALGEQFDQLVVGALVN